MSTVTAPATQQSWTIRGSYKNVFVPEGETAPISPYTAAGASNPVPLGSGLHGAVIGQAYSETITALSGTSPYTFAVTSGSLPSGLSLNGSTGAITGTPTTAGSVTFTVTVTDAISHTGAQAFTIVVAAAASGNFGFVS